MSSIISKSGIFIIILLIFLEILTNIRIFPVFPVFIFFIYSLIFLLYIQYNFIFISQYVFLKYENNTLTYMIINICVYIY